MISVDPLFYAAAIPAVLITGVSKSGFGGIALLAVPLMSLVISPIEAAAITLPLLLMMDAMGVFAWRGHADWSHLRVLLPGALVGVAVGGFTAHLVTADQIKLFVGVIAVLFCLYQWLPKPKDDGRSHEVKPVSGIIAGTFAGYTSYIAHAGAPPYHVYLIPKGLDRAVFAATGTWFFAVVNGMKMPAYMLAGQMSWDVIMQALVLAPLVPIGVYTGLWLNKRIDHGLFYKLIYGFVFVIGIKLIYDGIWAV